MMKWLVGTNTACDIRVVDMYASNQHCQITAGDDGTVYVEDLGSTNGTWLNGSRRVYGRTVMPAGSTLRVGRTDVILDQVFAKARYLELQAEQDKMRQRLRDSSPGLTEEQLDGMVAWQQALESQLDAAVNGILGHLAEQLEQKIEADPTRATEPGLRLAVKVIRLTMDPPRSGPEA